MFKFLTRTLHFLFHFNKFIQKNYQDKQDIRLLNCNKFEFLFFVSYQQISIK